MESRLGGRRHFGEIDYLLITCEGQLFPGLSLKTTESPEKGDNLFENTAQFDKDSVIWAR
jgi:hypothetical protein